ncbi:hypothetical protein Trydic_g12714 [Trypoxylus dichotomus]
MAPRKKRIVKNAALTARTRSGMKYQAPYKDPKKAITKKSTDVKRIKQLPLNTKPVESVVTRSHKKFGKYHFFTENEDLAQYTDLSKDDTDASTSAGSELHSIEEVLLPGPEIGMINEDEIVISDDNSGDEGSITDLTYDSPVVDITNDNSTCDENISLDSDEETEESKNEMECTATKDPEMLISQQMSSLNVHSEETSVNLQDGGSGIVHDVEYVAEPEKSATQLYHIETFESEVIIDCIAEEIIPICGEQEVINENEDSNGIKDVICEEVDEKQKTEDLTAILEGSRSEAEESIQKIQTAAEITSILEGDTEGTELLNLESKKDEVDQMEKYKVNIQDVEGNKCEVKDNKQEDMIEPEELPVITTKDKDETKLVVPDLPETKKELPKSKAKAKGPKRKTEKVDKNEKLMSTESSVRRSSRIKSISVLKQKSSKGHGLVKQKSDTSIKSIESENGDSNSSSIIESQPNKAGQKNAAHHGQSSHVQDHQKPVKMKSRWRRSSELELNNPISHNSSKPMPLSPTASQSDTNSNTANDEGNVQKDSEEVARRLKQFVHLKENLYLTERISCKEAKKMVCDCFLTEEDIAQGEYGCGEDCLNKLLMIECGSLCAVGDRCTNKRFQKGQCAPCEVFRTEKKGLGIRAAANIPYGEFILEYVGEVLDPEEFEKRAAEYSKDKNQHYYFMSLRADAVIDATRKGNVSRFINHSCDPNAETQKWTVNGELRIGFFSKRTILAGEEITFDYQFQRYGKEAQKCFCEASTCRGWLGEEPDDEDDEDEDDDEDEEEDEEEDDEDEANRKNETSQAVKDGSIQELPHPEAMESQDKVGESQAVPVVKPEKSPKKEKKKVLRQRLPRKELFEDLDLDDEIETLQTTGLKNQAHTLKLSRLMVRAKEPAQRQKLLRVLRRGELPCRRLFLDYHGLRLIHGWMTNAQHLSRVNRKFESLRLEILQTLATLPIPNKTMLQDSKVLPTVEKWSVKLEEEVSPIDSDSNSPKIDTDNTTTPDGVETKPAKIADEIMHETDLQNTGITPPPEQPTPIKLKAAIPPPLPPSSDLSVDHYETEIIALALKLLEEWSVLKEVFRIPKKERIEQMKEHEREADRKYKAGLGLDGQDSMLEKKDFNRYSLLSRRSKKKKRKNSHNDRDSFIDKYERRKMFAFQVEQREIERRRHQREFWRQHEQRCVVMGADPRFTAPFEPNQGYQCVWNPQTGQWQNYPLPGPPPAQNFNPNIPPHHQPPQQYVPPPAMGHNPHHNQPPPQSMLPPPMQQNAPMLPPPMQQNAPMLPPPMQQNAPMLPPPMQQNAPMLPPPMQPNAPMMKHLSQPPPHAVVHQKPPMGYNPQPTMPPLPPNPNQYGVRAPLPNMNVPNMGHMQPNQHPMYPHHMQPQQSQPPQMSQQQAPGYHLAMESQNPSMHGNMVPMPNMGKQPPPLPALPYQDTIKEQEEVRFMGPIPPPAKLPPKWKCAKDRYGRPYYYHIRIRKAQWEPPELPPPDENDELSETSSSSDTSSLSSDSSTEETDSDDEIDDAKLLLQIKNKFKQMDAMKNAEKPATGDTKDAATADDEDSKDEEPKERSLDDRLIEEFCFMKGNAAGQTKRKRVGLVQEILISPRTEEDRLQFKKDMKRYKQNKEKLKQQKELLLEQSKIHVTVEKPSKPVATPKPVKTNKKHKISVKTKLKEMVDNDAAKKIKESFRSNMAGVMVSILNTYRKPECKEGRITNTDDFKHLARKLTHFVMLKELKHCQNIEDLTCTESVKSKAREFVRKYMSKFGEIYQKPKDEIEFY